jgi:hypothetical protein
MSIFAAIILILTACHNSNEKTKQRIKEKDMTYPVKNISVSINKPADEVYLFASKPENFPAWIEFIGSMGKEKGNNGNIWFAETGLGNLKIEFVPQNNFGIIDHLVTLPDGSTVNNHMRVIANGNGSEFIFTLFWMPDRTEEEFIQDAKAVERDLRTLKKILESE